jgi:ABC-2 type transport system permease protein
MQKFLKHELDNYLRGRGSETRREPPLALVQREPYVWYRKGSLVMYALRDYIGEDKLNAALRKFLQRNKYAEGPYPDTTGFVACLCDATPPDLQYIIADMFESITLFDNKVVSATWVAGGPGKYRVELTLDAHKRRADGSGNETEIPINDLIDVGIFAKDNNGKEPIYLAKQRISQNTVKLTLLVDQKPYRAGIDPYNKLIDRKPDYNVSDVKAQ